MRETIRGACRAAAWRAVIAAAWLAADARGEETKTDTLTVVSDRASAADAEDEPRQYIAQPGPARSEEAAVHALAYAPDGRVLASAGEDKVIRLRDAGGVVATLAGHGDVVACLAFSPDGKTLASASNDRTVKLWDTASWKERPAPGPRPYAAMSVSYAPDGKTLAVAVVDPKGPPGGLTPFDAATLAERRPFGTIRNVVWTAAFAPDGRSIVAATTLGRLAPTIWDVSDGRLLRTLPSDRHVRVVAFSPDGRRVAGGASMAPTTEGAVLLWDAAGGTLSALLKGHRGMISGLGFSPDGRSLASASMDGTVKVWDIPPPGAAPRG